MGRLAAAAALWLGLPVAIAVPVAAVAAPGYAQTAAASSSSQAAGPGEPGNLLSYADSDFEGAAGSGDWTGVYNASLSQASTQAYLHDNSLRDAIGAAGNSIFQLSNVKIAVTGSAAYRAGGYFKVPAAAGRSVTWWLGFYDSSGNVIGWYHTPAIPLNSLGTWQYAAGTITAPSNAAYVMGSPAVVYSGASAGETIYLDELAFSLNRAAQAIGAYAGPTASDWLAADTSKAIGPLQTNKEFFQNSLPVQQPGGRTPFQQTQCYGIWATAGVQPPACIINYKLPGSQAQISAFVRSIPANQMVVLVFHQEPESKSFSACGTSGGAAFVCEFQAQASMIRAAGDYPNVFVAMDASAYQYGDPGSGHSDGYDCSYIPPASDVDLYLVDHYEGQMTGRIPPTGGALPAAGTPYQQEWTNWLRCVAGQGKPIGLAEYGLRQSLGASLIGQALSADNAYLAGSLGEGLDAPVLFWEYWWYANSAFTSSATESLWRSFESGGGG